MEYQEHVLTGRCNSGAKSATRAAGASEEEERWANVMQVRRMAVLTTAENGPGGALLPTCEAYRQWLRTEAMHCQRRRRHYGNAAKASA